MRYTTEKNALHIQIGKQISRLRREKKWTQEQLAELLNISIKHCSAVERGKSALSMEKLITLCDLFDVSLDYLIGWNDTSATTGVPKFVREMFQNASPQMRENLIELFKVLQHFTDSKAQTDAP